MTRTPKRPRDPNQLAHQIIQIASGQEIDSEGLKTQSRGDSVSERLSSGGAKGGSARAASLSAERRQEIARLAASSRWQGKNQKP